MQSEQSVVYFQFLENDYEECCPFMLPDKKKCIWRAVFFVRILSFETSDPFEFDKKTQPGSVLSVQIDEGSY
jgi:hypothetical protein